ncbi:DNA repair protein RecN [Rarobacter faecitabidus]|uniref:DNA repair protein RecN n=1 Tax=Rarobacter faecitabidus TaxID=13243 RepID=A0A542ZWK4_RARFA|nr:DNA repair protein RecN [Rarobacter faecitabidus]TQL64570.1 DNA replication and repair protein RecN [Rarobacter faecitabidus]
MIRDLRIVNLGVIADARLEPGPGLTAITGETGAGKTMLLQGLDLLRGARADLSLIRAGQDEAVVECEVEIPDERLRADIDQAGGRLEEDATALIVRSVRDGKSRFLIGGRAVPRSAVADVLGKLLTVHGQSDQIRLRDAATQRDTLDHYAGAKHLAALERYRALWRERSELAARLEELVSNQAERAREAELLRLGLEQVEAVAPQAGEDAELDATAERLRHSEDLSGYVSAAYSTLGGDGGEASANAAGAVHEALRQVARAANHDPSLSLVHEELTDVSFRLGEVSSRLAGYLSDLIVEPGRLDAIEERRSQLAKLMRSYGPTLADVLAWADEAGRRLMELDGDGDATVELRDRLAELDAELGSAASEITAARGRAARRLERAVKAELSELAMASATLAIEVSPRDGLGLSGGDDITMLFSAHPDAPRRPLAKAASGGELSRVMLALEVVLADSGSAGKRLVMVFDEIDAGVGGRTATHIGKRLARLAELHQVIVITHLAQVAALAGTQLVVGKDSVPGRSVSTTVTTVTGDARVVELARMLSGEQDSHTARAHASELLAAAGRGE